MNLSFVFESDAQLHDLVSYEAAGSSSPTPRLRARTLSYRNTGSHTNGDSMFGRQAAEHRDSVASGVKLLEFEP